ncbi:MAG TPA: AlpA family phage regulatory protein [Rubrivivax sp.]|nr:AlpA family phage regulatory protein [Rubrivivax sp.]
MMNHIQDAVNESNVKPLLIDIKQVCNMIGMSPAFTWGRVAANRFPKPIKLGRATRWRASDVEEWVNQQAAAAQEGA